MATGPGDPSDPQGLQGLGENNLTSTIISQRNENATLRNKISAQQIQIASLEALVQSLASQVEALKVNQFPPLPKSNPATPPSESSQMDCTVHNSQSTTQTQADGFQTVTRKKKRRRFSPISQSGDSSSNHSDSEEEDPEPHERSPPPIIIRNKKLWPSLHKALAKIDITPRRAINTTDSVKVYPQTVNDFRLLTSHLDKSKIEYSTFQLQEEKELVVVIRGVNEALNDNEILQELENKKLPVRRIHRMKKGDIIWPLVAVYLDPDSPSANSIFDIKSIAGLRVKVEAKQKSKIIPQCKRCLRFFHTANYCHAAWSCAFCSKDHATPSCPLKDKKNSKPVCANCKGDHRATYRGCPKAPKKEADKSTQPKVKNQPPNKTSPSTTVNTTPPVNKPSPYVNAAKRSTSVTSKTIPTPTPNLKNTLDQFSTNLQNLFTDFIKNFSAVTQNYHG